eukprot:9264701-Prorocentrum_lima.AAC.1
MRSVVCFPKQSLAPPSRAERYLFRVPPQLLCERCVPSPSGPGQVSNLLCQAHYLAQSAWSKGVALGLW